MRPSRAIAFLTLASTFMALAISLACGKPQPAPAAAAASAGAPPLLDPALTAYAGPQVSGEVASIGSDSMDPLIQLWADDFRALNPAVSFRIVSKGSATAPRALLAGDSLIGQMSRPMNEAELAAFQEKFGYAPTQVIVAADALAIYVNAGNPLPKLSLAQVDAIFGRERKAGYPKDLRGWGDFGLENGWQTKVIQPYGRNENSGTRAFFQEHVLLKGAYRPEVKALDDQFATVEAVASDPDGIAYGPIQHKVQGVRAVPLENGGAAVMPSMAAILAGDYPLTRFLYIYVNKAPGKPLPGAVRAFLAYAISRNGQASVASFGAIPIRADVAQSDLAKLD
ncbi:MAG TPA: phosphate ABC transporter substrate-binding protein [Holophagaceae bacterium]|nr:phosphate ABC transporter substrate-binding protein [Holophagaceae bacterium]